MMKILDWIIKGIKKLAGFPLHVFFLCFYAVLSFLAVNLSQVNGTVANRLLLYFSLGTLALLLIVRLFAKNFPRAGVLLFLFLFVFFTYEPVKILLLTHFPSVARDVFLVPVFFILLLGALILVLRQPAEKLRTLTVFLNVFGLILLAFPIYRIIAYESRMRSYEAGVLDELEVAPSASPVSLDSLPDVYFIILDGYARADVLEQEIDLDNTAFLDSLRERSFYVADCSMSNYAQTELSLSSTLNMTYLDEVIEQIPVDAKVEEYFSPYIKNSIIRQYFESLGYQTISFYNGYYWAQWDDADYYLGDPRFKYGLESVLPFEVEFLQTTLYRLISDAYRTVIPQPEYQDGFISGSEAARTIVLFTLEKLPAVAQLRSPKFVFVHLMLPHPPYVFGQDGEEQFFPPLSEQALLLKGYHDQLLYANKRILPILDSILSQSDGNAVIFLEGDHGLVDYQQEWTRMANLSAYYFPDQDYSSLYPWITPVNSFRVLLTQYFGMEYPLLDDLSYFSSDSTDQTLDLIPNPCEGK